MESAKVADDRGGMSASAQALDVRIVLSPSKQSELGLHRARRVQLAHVGAAGYWPPMIARSYAGAVANNGGPVPLPRNKLDEMLDGLEAALPKMVVDYPDDDLFWPYFSGHAEMIEGSASEDDYAHVGNRVRGMLLAIGKVRPEDSGRRRTGHG